MAPTLQDVAYLLGLPIVGEVVGPCVVPSSWKNDLEDRFTLVQRVEEAGPIMPHPRAAGPSKTWLLQFAVHILFIFTFIFFNLYDSLSAGTLHLICLCSPPSWIRMPTRTV